MFIRIIAKMSHIFNHMSKAQSIHYHGNLLFPLRFKTIQVTQRIIIFDVPYLSSIITDCEKYLAPKRSFRDNIFNFLFYQEFYIFKF